MQKSNLPADDPSCLKFSELPSGQSWYGVNACTSLLVNSWKNAEIKPAGVFLQCNYAEKKRECCSDQILFTSRVHHYPTRTACSGQLAPASSSKSPLGHFYLQDNYCAEDLTVFKMSHIQNKHASRNDLRQHLCSKLLGCGTFSKSCISRANSQTWKHFT